MPAGEIRVTSKSARKVCVKSKLTFMSATGRSFKRVIVDVIVGAPVVGMVMGKSLAVSKAQFNSKVVKLNAGPKVPSPQPFLGLTCQ